MGEAFGWTSEDLPLGNTEALDEATHRMLNLTDFVYRRYTRGTDSFEVYIGYWAPGTMPARDMNSHTPDTCWVNAGWTTTESKLESLSFTDDRSLLPGRWRWFKKDDASINVIFWHLLDGEPYQYGHKSFTERLSKLIIDPFKYHLNMRREQYLIRISSNSPLDHLWDESLSQSILAKIAPAPHIHIRL